MTDSKSYLKDKYILVVDDEVDILETIEEMLDIARLDLVEDYQTALEKIKVMTMILQYWILWVLMVCNYLRKQSKEIYQL